MTRQTEVEAMSPFHPRITRYRSTNFGLLFALFLTGCTGGGPEEVPGYRHELFEAARKNGVDAREALSRCRLYLHGWLARAEPRTGLIPRNLDRTPDLWNPQDSAADNYPFMVLTSYLVEPELYRGRMREMLESERRLTSRVGPLPDAFLMSSQEFADPEVNLEQVIFGSSEYVKDGLLPVTELLGDSPWSDRLLEILDGIWERAPIPTGFGPIVSTNPEVNGEMLQTLARIYWFTGEQRYLDWAIRLGDYYLLGGNHPTRDSDRLRLRDHGCEIVSGLCELYATLSVVSPGKKLSYQASIEMMLDRILEVGRNEDGLFFNVINPKTGQCLDDRLADTWGYTLNGFYTVYLVDQTQRYRQAVLTALGNLPKYRDYNWENGSSDGFADALESALNLFNREPIDEAAVWIDQEIRVMWSKQQPDGVIEGWHGDGNFARTTIMYALWKSRGLRAEPWREDLLLGAASGNDNLYVALEASSDWQGTLAFDVARHRAYLQLPFDWPRINQFPEWTVVTPGSSKRQFEVGRRGHTVWSAEQLTEGIPLTLSAGEKRLLLFQPAD